MKRILYFDLIRIFACLMVIAQHAPCPHADINSVILSAVSFLDYPAVPLFFMISGALILPVKYVNILGGTKRFEKVFWPTLIFTFFYITVRFISGEMVLLDLPKIILSIPFSPQGTGVLWFMYVLIGAYLVFPIISQWLINVEKKQVEIVLLLWIITLCYPFLNQVLYVNCGDNNILFSFSGYFGYFILGYYLNHYDIKINNYLLCLLFIIPVGVYGITKLWGVEIDAGYLSLWTAMMAVFWIMIIKKMSSKISFSEKTKKILSKVSSLTFGIYLIHYFVLTRFVWKLDIVSNNSSITGILIAILLTFSISLLNVYIISFLPFAKYLIGYNNKK